MGGFEVILPLISGAMGALGSYQQAQAQAATANAQAEAEAINAQIQAANADIARNDGKEAQARAAEDAYKAMGRQRAALAQGGLLSSPTGLLLQDESQADADREQLQIGRQAELNALGYDIQKSNALYSSGIYKANAKSAKAGGYLGLAGGILSGVSQSYNNYQLYHSGPYQDNQSKKG